MLTRGKLERGVVEMVDMESLAPPDHLLRKIDIPWSGPGYKMGEA